MTVGSGILCQPCVDELGLTVAVAVMAIRRDDELHLCVRCGQALDGSIAAPVCASCITYSGVTRDAMKGVPHTGRCPLCGFEIAASHDRVA